MFVYFKFSGEIKMFKQNNDVIGILWGLVQHTHMYKQGWICSEVSGSFRGGAIKERAS